MAGLVNNFQSGSNLMIYAGNVLMAYCTNFSFSRNMSQGAVGGIGGFSYDALEPLSYSASGSFTITRYVGAGAAALTGKVGYQMPTKSNGGFNNTGTDGNSMLHPSQFNPTALLTGKTLNFEIYERKALDSNDGVLVYTIENARFTGYSIGFTPGSLVSENISFKAIKILDAADSI